MPRTLRIWLVSLGSPLLLLAAVAWWVWCASQDVPVFYQTSIASPAVNQTEASDDLVRDAMALANQAQKEGPWEAMFTEDQINGWLAVDLVKNHSQLLPPELSEPRIQIRPDGAVLACRYRSGGFSTVCWLDVEISIDEPNVLAIRVRKARAGALPVPLESILDGIDQATAGMDVGVQWLKIEGDPLALVTIPPPEGEGNSLIWVDSLQLGDGQIHVAGRTVPRDEASEGDTPPARAAIEDQPEDSSNSQR